MAFRYYKLYKRSFRTIKRCFYYGPFVKVRIGAIKFDATRRLTLNLIMTL